MPPATRSTRSRPRTSSASRPGRPWCPACCSSTTCMRWACARSEEHTSELQSQSNLVCRLLLEKKKNNIEKKNTLLISIQSEIAEFSSSVKKNRDQHSHTSHGTSSKVTLEQRDYQTMSIGGVAYV